MLIMVYVTLSEVLVLKNEFKIESHTQYYNNSRMEHVFI